jgi:hypothetical protein
MVSRVKVKMNMCGKEHIIAVDTIGKNNFSLEVESDCPNVRTFIKGMDLITMDDLFAK